MFDSVRKWKIDGWMGDVVIGIVSFPQALVGVNGWILVVLECILSMCYQ